MRPAPRRVCWTAFAAGAVLFACAPPAGAVGGWTAPQGFAEFMPGQYWAQKLGAHAEQDYYADEYHQFMGIEGRRPMPLASMGSNNIYPKGALVLEMLKHYLGEERFWTRRIRLLGAAPAESKDEQKIVPTEHRAK